MQRTTTHPPRRWYNLRIFAQMKAALTRMESGEKRHAQIYTRSMQGCSRVLQGLTCLFTALCKDVQGLQGCTYLSHAWQAYTGLNISPYKRSSGRILAILEQRVSTRQNAITTLARTLAQPLQDPCKRGGLMAEDTFERFRRLRGTAPSVVTVPVPPQPTKEAMPVGETIPQAHDAPTPPEAVPCVVCGEKKRWHDAPVDIWRCIACWPPFEFATRPAWVTRAGAAAAKSTRRTGDGESADPMSVQSPHALAVGARP
jgi:hypothetical protein